MSLRRFIQQHYRHFNAAVVSEAADAYVRHLEGGGKMLLAMAGAMSTAELGRSLAEMIRRDRVHAISCTGANLEEDLYNLVAHDHYLRIPEWRSLKPEEEKDLELRGLNRVTDTCIPEVEALKKIEKPMFEIWRRAEREGERLFPHESFYRLLREGIPADQYQIDPRDSWLLAAAEKDLPMFVPGWEDSTLGNYFASRVLHGQLSAPGVIRSGLEYMRELADWYARTTMGVAAAELEAHAAETGPELRAVPPAEARTTIGFFQIGGGIAGDFAICVVPMIQHDLRRRCPYWGYFCQIGDSTTSYGSYSGAFPSEKITWGKLDLDTPKFTIESDATIVAPLIFGYVLDW